MKPAVKKRYISFIIVIFMIFGVCFENTKADSSFEYTNKESQEISGITGDISSVQDICTDDLLRISEKDNEIIREIVQGIRLKTNQNYRLRFLTPFFENYIQNHVYMTETLLIKLLSGIIFSSVAVILYIHAQDGEKTK